MMAVGTATQPEFLWVNNYIAAINGQRICEGTDKSHAVYTGPPDGDRNVVADWKCQSTTESMGITSTPGGAFIEGLKEWAGKSGIGVPILDGVIMIPTAIKVFTVNPAYSLGVLSPVLAVILYYATRGK